MTMATGSLALSWHDDVIKWKLFLRYWPFVRGIHRSAVNSPHKGWWHGALMFSFICVWNNSWVNNGDAGDFRRLRAHYDVIVMIAVAESGNRTLADAVTPTASWSLHNLGDSRQLKFHGDIIKMETLSALLAICAGNSPVTGEFPAQRPVTRSLDVFCDLRLSKHSWG